MAGHLFFNDRFFISTQGDFFLGNYPTAFNNYMHQIVMINLEKDKSHYERWKNIIGDPETLMEPH